MSISDTISDTHASGDTLRANTEQKFLLKFLLIGVACTAFAGWATYDVLVKYPAQIPRLEAWEELLANDRFDDEQRIQEYRRLAEENGWSNKRPTGDETLKKLKENFIWNYGFIIGGLGIGLPLIAWYLLNRNSWIELTGGDKITSSWGQSVEFDTITQFDKKKWQKKGIGVIYYDTNGSKKFVIDDLKFERRTTDRIVNLMEQAIGVDKIVNGLPENQSTSNSG